MSSLRLPAGLVCVASSAPLVIVLVGCAGEEATARPNIVLAIADDQDYEHLGFLGNQVGHTPTLDRLAESGTVFEVMHTPPRCRPSLAALLSGLHPHQSGIYYNRGADVLADGSTLPALLREVGYVTYAAGKFWEGVPTRVGFDAPAAEDPSFAREGQEAEHRRESEGSSGRQETKGRPDQ